LKSCSFQRRSCQFLGNRGTRQLSLDASGPFKKLHQFRGGEEFLLPYHNPMAMLPCGAYAKAETEKCAQSRDNGYWRCDEWADDWCYKCPSWQPGKFMCYAFVCRAKWLTKACHRSAHKVCVSFEFTKVFLCVLYVSSLSLPRLFGKILGFDTLAIPSPTSPFGPALNFFKNTFFLAWIGKDPEHRLHVLTRYPPFLTLTDKVNGKWRLMRKQKG